jgi:hypothetical protein
MTKFVSSLLFAVRIDGGELWAPSSDMCKQVPPGLSWVGRGRDLLYSDCAAERLDLSEAACDILPGGHGVEMIAWLPGTRITLTARTRLQLGCDH